MIIGVDIDGTSGYYTEALRKSVAGQLAIVEAEHLTTMPDPTDYGFSTWELIAGQFREYHGRAVEEGIYYDMEVFPGVSEALHRLSDEGHRIIFITSRFVNPGQHARVVSDTVAWLDKHDLPYDDILFLRDKHLFTADVFIDDAPDKVTNLQNAGHNVIIFDAPYNQHLEGPRVDNWEDAYALLQEHALKLQKDAG